MHIDDYGRNAIFLINLKAFGLGIQEFRNLSSDAIYSKSFLRRYDSDSAFLMCDIFCLFIVTALTMTCRCGRSAFQINFIYGLSNPLVFLLCEGISYSFAVEWLFGKSFVLLS